MPMSHIRVAGDQFEINGQRRPYRTRTSFCLVAHYQRGQRDRGRRWLDRIQSQGFDGPRFFCENQDWSGGPFFGSEHTPIVRAFGDHSGPFSQLNLIAGYKELIRQLADDLIERGMVAEATCIATIKGREAGWTGQGLNKFAQMFRELFPDPNNTPFLHETVNEIDAHIHPTLRDPAEWKRMGPRWRRDEPGNPSHHNYPGSTVGVSAGGQFSPGFDDSGYTHRNIHPERGADWWKGEEVGGGREALAPTLGRLRVRANGRPVAFNETVHYMTRGQWDFWVEKPESELGIPKWRGLSTTDHGRLQAYTEEVLAHGVSFCGHDLIGMSTDPDLPETPMEAAWRELFGGSTPPPAKRHRYRRVIELAYQEILGRPTDPVGLDHYNAIVTAGLSEAQLRESLIRSDEYNAKNPN